MEWSILICCCRVQYKSGSHYTHILEYLVFGVTYTYSTFSGKTKIKKKKITLVIVI